ncbi:MAG: hypothetical protein QME81_00550 [bacterium]|nr:hypothetical protein [bacterium]
MIKKTRGTMPLIYLLIIIPLSLVQVSLIHAAEKWLWQPVEGIRSGELKAVAIHPDNPGIICVGSSRGVYITRDEGKLWEVKLAGRSINAVLIYSAQRIYAGGENALYLSKNEGQDWEEISAGQGDILSLCIDPVDSQKIYLGTKTGLFRSRDSGRTWQKDPDLPDELTVNFLSANKSGDNSFIYLAANHGLFKQADSSWERVFVSHVQGEEEEEDAEEIETSGVSTVIIDPEDSSRLYLGTRDGVFESKDGGDSWKALTGTGLTNPHVNFLLIDSGDLYAAAQGGIFRFLPEEGRWENQYAGLTDERIVALASSPGILWAVSDQRVYRAAKAVEPALPKKMDIDQLLLSFFHEPTIREVQAAAIRYAEVEPEKIKGWRRRAAFKAVLPDVSLSYEKTIYGSATTKVSSDDGGKYGVIVTGPNAWRTSLSWNLDDLIYNNDQTSIDNRSKLMVQLRDDILDEVTMIYFERRRLQADLILSPPPDIREQFRIRLRIDELTANLDALTGGYFSRARTK